MRNRRSYKGWLIMLLASAVFTTVGCARMGQPDGGWYDETPPHVVGASPADQSVGVKSKKIVINFDEFIKIDNPSEKVVVSPPQMEAPEIAAKGKRIVVEIADSLKANTTYTIDFSDAITDNNEGNPLGNYTYSFSTGQQIDTLQVSGYVQGASDMEPVKGILVGLYDDLSDSAFTHKPMLRVSRTDSRGRFIIKGVAPGAYHIFALQDADGNYQFSQKSERIAFLPEVIKPTCKPDVRQDTLWRDSLHIKNILPVKYTHFLPDDIVLRAFTEEATERYFIKAERQQANHFTLFFSYGGSELPTIRGLNFDSSNAFLMEKSLRNDTLTYWLRDTALVNQDSLNIQLSYLMTDSTGQLRQQTDTLLLLSKEPYARRLKQQQKDYEQWKKKQLKANKKGEAYDSIMPPPALVPQISGSDRMTPDRNVPITFTTPLLKADTSKIHLYYSVNDSVWHPARFVLRHRKHLNVPDSVPESEWKNEREYELVAEWRPARDYSLEIDSAAFCDIYGRVNSPIKEGIRTGSDDDYGTLLMTIEGMGGKHVIAQLLDDGDKVVKQVRTSTGQAEFFYLEARKYYLRIFVDENNNGVWDTGNYEEGRQPEQVYYYPESIECKKKWDITLSWNPTRLPLYRQKPDKITKQRPDQEKKIAHRNEQRAKNKGIQYIPGVTK